MAAEHYEVTKDMLATALGCNADEAYLLIRFAEARGWVKAVGNMPAKGGRGRGLTIYRVPSDLGDRLKEMWDERKDLAE